MPEERKDVAEHVNCAFFIQYFHAQTQFAHTIMTQSHLTPMPVYCSPVYWDYDHCMRLYPMPDLVVFADRHEPFTVTRDAASEQNKHSRSSTIAVTVSLF